MPTYEVILTRDVTESAVITVEASDADAARLAAWDHPVDPSSWETDDSSAGTQYVTDVTEVPEYEVKNILLPAGNHDSYINYRVYHRPTSTYVDGVFEDYDNARMWADQLNSAVQPKVQETLGGYPATLMDRLTKGNN